METENGELFSAAHDFPILSPDVSSIAPTEYPNLDRISLSAGADRGIKFAFTGKVSSSNKY